jgi:hypothetical protein
VGEDADRVRRVSADKTGDAGPVATAPHVAADSPLAGLGKQRQAAQEQRYLDLRVPSIEPPLWIRYLPVESSVLSQLDDKRESELKQPQTRASANLRYGAGVLARSCAGIFRLDEDGKPVGDPSTWPRFDRDLAEALEVPFVNSTILVSALYVSDGDVTSAGNEVADFSGYTARAERRELQGE